MRLAAELAGDFGLASDLRLFKSGCVEQQPVGRPEGVVVIDLGIPDRHARDAAPVCSQPHREMHRRGPIKGDHQFGLGCGQRFVGKPKQAADDAERLDIVGKCPLHDAVARLIAERRIKGAPDTVTAGKDDPAQREIGKSFRFANTQVELSRGFGVALPIGYLQQVRRRIMRYPSAPPDRRTASCRCSGR